MPKSKDQKRAEALQRLRDGFPQWHAYMLECQRDGRHYLYELNMNGEADANALAAQEMARFRIKCKEAGLDIHGNPQ